MTAPSSRARPLSRVVVPFALFASAVLTGVPLPTGSASAAALGGAPPVSMILQSQSAWNSPARPLAIRVRVTNAGTTPLSNLAITLTIGFPVRSRSVYEESLLSDPTGQLFTTTFAEGGTIGPGASRTIAIKQDLADVSGIVGSWVLYPVRVELRSADDLLATIRTPMVFLTTPPTVPLDLAWTYVLSEPMQVGPDGIFQPGPIEKDIAQGGRLERIAQALDRPDPPRVNLAVSPVLVGELATMADGYRIVRPGGTIETVRVGAGGAANAADLLASLIRIAKAPTTEITAQPFGDASLPAIQASGLGNLSTLIVRGRADIAAALSTFPSATTFRPPMSALDGRSFAQLVDGGVRTFLFDPEFIPTPPHLPFSPASVGRVLVGRRSALAVLPDADLAKLTTSYPSDPVLSAHAALGEMAATWLEAPGTSGRGVAMLFPDADTSPPQLYPTLVDLVTASPWLNPERISTYVSPGQVAPPQGEVVRLPARTYPKFEPSYLDRLRSALGALRQFRATASGPDAVAEEATLSTDLLIAEAGTFVTDPSAGLRYIEAVWYVDPVTGPRGAIARTYRLVEPDSRTITLTSQHGSLPLTVSNGASFVLHVRVVLEAVPGLVFADGGVKTATLPPNASVPLVFGVSAEKTGRFPLNVTVQTPGGARIAMSQVVVRSTAYNRVALAITVGAGLFLAIWWGRGVLRRRRS